MLKTITTQDPVKVKTIAHVTPHGLFLGGGERVASLWGQHLPEGVKGYFLYQEREDSVDVYDYGRLERKSYKESKHINGMLKSLKPDVIIDHGITWFPELAKTVYKDIDCPIVYFLHGCALLEQRDHAWYAKQGLDMKYAISNYGTSILEKWPIKYLVQQLQIDAEKYRYFRREYLYPIRVGIVGRISQEKIPLSFARELAKFRNDKFQFYIVGEGLDYKKPLLNIFKGKHHITYVGALQPEQMYQEVYRHLDVLMVPSESESGGYAMMEAMATGIPVIARNTGALPETVGDGGIICEDNDRELLKALMPLGQFSVLREYSKKAKAKIEEHNSSIATQIANYHEFLNRIV